MERHRQSHSLLCPKAPVPHWQKQHWHNKVTHTLYCNIMNGCPLSPAFLILRKDKMIPGTRCNPPQRCCWLYISEAKFPLCMLLDKCIEINELDKYCKSQWKKPAILLISDCHLFFTNNTNKVINTTWGKQRKKKLIVKSTILLKLWQVFSQSIRVV